MKGTDPRPDSTGSPPPPGATCSVNYEWDAENPACACCGAAMFLLEGCEWHDDPAMNLCHQCALGALTDARDAIEEIRQVATGEKQVANDDTEAMQWIVERIAKLKSPNPQGTTANAFPALRSSASLCLSRPWTWRDKLRCKLWPPQHCDLPEAPPTHKDVLVCRVTSELSWRDRLRVLATGRIRVESRTVTENIIGEHKTKSVFMALPPRWWDREA